MNDNYKVLQLTEDDVRNGQPNSMSVCPIALAFDREECMNRDGEHKPGMSPWVAEVHCSDEMYIQKEGEGAKNYYGVYIHRDDRSDVDDFIQAVDAPSGETPELEDLIGFRFRYRLEHCGDFKDLYPGEDI